MANWKVVLLGIAVLLSPLSDRILRSQEGLPTPDVSTESTESTEPKVEETEAAPSPEQLEQFGSPRATFETFMAAMQTEDAASALTCLDLSQLLSESASAKGGSYSTKIYAILKILTEGGFIDVELMESRVGFSEATYSISDVTFDYIDAYNPYGAPLTKTDLKDVAKIVLSRGSDRLWRFSPSTIEAIDELHESWESRKLLKPIWPSSMFPSYLRQTHFLIHDYQWICLLVLVVLAIMADLAVRKLLYRIMHRWLKKANEDEEKEIGVWKPLGLLAQASILYAGAKIIDLPLFALDILITLLKPFAVFAAVWTGLRLIEVLSRYLHKHAQRTESGFDDLAVPLITTCLKAIVLIIGLVVVTLIHPVSEKAVTGIFGGLGISGLVLAFASKDAVSNFFGSLTVLFDRPFEIGDWVLTDGIEGTVERVGFRSTRIRTFYNSVITLPNSRLTTAVVDNMGRRRFRRYRAILSVTYDSQPELMEAFCEGIRELIRRHRYTRKDDFHVYVNAFNESSVDILLYCFFRCSDWATELDSRHKLILDIMRLASELGIEFAFPTRTLQMFQCEADENGELESDDPIRLGQNAAVKIISEK